MPGTPATSPKFGAPRYANADAVDFAGQVNGVTDIFDTRAMRLDTGLASARPAAAIAGRWYYTTDGKWFSRDTGSAWEDPVVPETAMATGANGLAKGAFSAYRNAASSLATGAVVPFDTEEFDVSGWNVIAGTIGYTPQVPGYYAFSWCVAVASVTVDNWIQASLYKNGTLFKQGQIMNFRTAAAGAMSTGSAQAVAANGSTDRFDIRLGHNQAGSVALAVGASATYFQGRLVGRS